MRRIRTLLRRPTRGTLKATSPWTMDDAHRHAAAMAAFDALLKRDGGFNECSTEHCDAMRRVGETTVSLDWYFFAASRQIRAQVEG